MKSMLIAATASVRKISASTMAVALMFGAALLVPAVSGVLTGSQAEVAISQDADWRQHNPRQRRIVIARNNRASEMPTAVAQTELKPAI